MAAFAVLAVSCGKEIVRDVPEQDGDRPGDARTVSKVFGASAGATKTAVGDLVDGVRTITWVKDDPIDIFWNGGSVSASASSSGASTTFSAEVGESPAYWAVYPSGAGSAAENGVTVTIPSTQDVSKGFGSAHYAAAVAVGDNFGFMNVCSWLRFTVSDPSVKRVLIRGNGEQNLAGKVTVTFNADGSIASTAVSGGNSRLIVDVDGEGEYYAAVLPGINLENGVGFRFYTAHETAPEKAIKTGVFSPKALKVDAGAIKNLGDITSRIVTDWYISPEGSGTKDGMSEANAAAGVEFLRSRLAQDMTTDKTKNGLAKGYGCIDVTIHAAPGEYDFKDGEISVAWPGHTSVVGTSIVGAGETTVFMNTGNSRLFKVGQNADLSFSGIRFTGGNPGSGTGGAICLDHATASLELEDCVLDGNAANLGGAIGISSGSSIDISGCTIKGNRASDTGAGIYVGGASTLKIAGTEISGNESNNYAGGICVKAAAKLYMNACAIFGNSNTTAIGGSRWGPAVFVESGKAADLCMNNCTVGEHSTAATNTDTYDTCVDVQGGNLVFANSTMIANSFAGMFRVHDTAGNGTYINSVIVNKKGNSINYNSNSGTCVSKYVISGKPQPGKRYNPTADIDKANVTYADLGSPAFDDADGVYRWNGNLSGCPAAPSPDTAAELIRTADADFHAWLESIGALEVDQLGNSRAVNRQGSYCGN